jgi:hypothetical protein
MPNLGKRRIHHLWVVVTVAGALTAGLYAQRGGQTTAPQASGPRPSTAPSLVPVRLGVMNSAETHLAESNSRY